MDPTDFINSSETRLAVSRIITWTTEPKSSDVRKVRPRCCSAALLTGYPTIRERTLSWDWQTPLDRQTLALLWESLDLSLAPSLLSPALPHSSLWMLKIWNLVWGVHDFLRHLIIFLMWKQLSVSYKELVSLKLVLCQYFEDRLRSKATWPYGA